MEQDTRLYHAMNASVRFILGIRRDVHITPFYEALRWLKVDQRRTYFVGCLLFCIMKMGDPNCIFIHFKTKGNVASKQTRAAADLLILPNC